MWIMMQVSSDKGLELGMVSGVDPVLGRCEQWSYPQKAPSSRTL